MDAGVVNSPGFTLALQQCENVLFPNGALDVSDDRSRGVVHELDAYLGDTTSRSSSSEDLEKGGEGPVSEKKKVDSRVDCQRTLITLASLTGAFDVSWKLNEHRS